MKVCIVKGENVYRATKKLLDMLSFTLKGKKVLKL